MILADAQLRYLLAPLVIMTVNIGLAAYILKLLISSRFVVSTLFLMRIALLGSMASLVAPANAGGFLRAYLIKEKYGRKFVEVFAFVLLEFVLDLLTVFVVGFIGVVYFSRIISGALPYALALVTIVVIGYSIIFRPQIIQFVVKKIAPTRLYSTLATYLGSLWRAFVSVSKKPQLLMRVSVVLLIHHLLFGLSLYFIFRSIAVERPMLDVIFANSVFGVVSSAPSLPAKLGHFELAGILAFVKPLSVTTSQAAAVTLIRRALGITYITLASIIVLLVNKDDLLMLKRGAPRIAKLKNEIFRQNKKKPNSNRKGA